ncbi:MAG: GspH/FimT family pseudopilin [Woeseiaceae bacterium]|nr:GspH/FimT family pseudopilin [Woeseiaceae bacterium]
MLKLSGGYTLYELLVTVVIISAVLTLGIPSFSDVLARQRQRVELNALFHAIHLAKKESIVRNRVVTICPSRDLEQCDSTTNWSEGWLIFENTDKDHPARIDDAEPIVARHKVGRNVTLKSNRRSYTFRSTQKRATNGTIVVCDNTARIRPRALVLSYTGRPRITHDNRYGTPYSCSD